MSTTITTEGNLTADPDLRFTNNTGQSVCTLRVAVSMRRKNTNDGYADTPAVYYEATVWGALAEHTVDSVRKGDRVLLHGVTFDEEWTDREGRTRVKHVIQVNAIGASLRYATATIRRLRRAGTDLVPDAEPDAEQVEASSVSGAGVA